MSLAILAVALALNALVSRDLPHPLPIEYWGLMWGTTGFVAGFLICDLVHDTQAPLVPAFWELCLGALVFALLPFHPLHILLPIGFAALIAVTYSAESRLGRFLGSPWIFYFGGLSYSVYIWHAPVIKAATLALAVRQVGGSNVNLEVSGIHKLIYCLGTTVAVLAVANASYYWFETPLRKILRRAFNGGPVARSRRLDVTPEVAKSTE
jgi:peptidoglycan/LPS O-acetylase OafA/YrhL